METYSGTARAGTGPIAGGASSLDESDDSLCSSTDNGSGREILNERHARL